MLVNIIGAKCIGIDAVPVTVEVDVVPGIGIHYELPIFFFVLIFVIVYNTLKEKGPSGSLAFYCL